MTDNNENDNSTIDDRLHLAAGEGDIVTIAKLLDNGVNLETRDGHGKTPLFYAVKSNRLTAVQFLLESGANVNAQDDTGATILHVAATENLSCLIYILYEARANFDLQDNDGMTPLCVAKKLYHSVAEMTLDMLTWRVDQCDTSKNDDSPIYHTPLLSHAAAEGNTEAVKFLLEKGANVNIKTTDDTPLLVRFRRYFRCGPV